MFKINQKNIELLVEELAPKITALTGWDTSHFSKINIELIKSSQVWEKDFRPFYDFLEVDLEPKTESGKLRKEFMQKFFPLFVSGIYAPTSNTVMIVGSNFDLEHTNKNGLTTLIGHELVHTCQLEHNTSFKEAHYSLFKETCGDNVFDEDESVDPMAIKYLGAHKLFAEGDAYFIQKELKKRFYPGAKIKGLDREISIADQIKFISLSGDLDKAFSDKKKGIEFIERIMQTQNRVAVNSLYKLDAQELYEVVYS